MKSDRGFTLIELLVVVIIIGILSAIALPTLLNQTKKAKETEARQNIAAVNRAQVAYRYGTNSKQFASSFDLLALGMLTGNSTDSTRYYSYTLNANTVDDDAIIRATPRDNVLRGYEGGVRSYANSLNISVINSVVCEAATPGNTPNVGLPTNINPGGICTGGNPLNQ